MRTVVTGASRGLGLEFCKQLLADGHEVLALARKPQGSAELQQLGSQENCTVLACDVSDPDSITTAAGQIAEHVDGLDLLINNAGVIGSQSQGLSGLDYEQMQDVITTNTYGPLRITAALLDLLKKSQAAKVVHITSKVGSMADNGTGGYWAYRMSKAALNMACVNMAHELRDKNIATMVLHPGWVATDMGGRAAPLSVEDSVAGMLRVIGELGIESSGCFRDFQGETIPW